MSEPSSWNAFWHRAEPAINLTMLRIVASGTALWVLLSRPSLPQIASWPRPFYDSIPAGTRIRYGLFADTFLEQALFVVLIGMLVLAAAGVAVRATAFASALLLYHFAPFESVIWTPNPYLRGLTIPLLALLFIAFGPPHRDGTALVSAWPVRAVQVVLAQMYFFAGYAKLLTSGIAWAGGENIGRYLQLLEQNYGVSGIPFGYRLAAVPLLPAAIGWAGLIFELSFPLALVSRLARRILVPSAVLFHILNSILFHIFFHEMTMLLVFVPWQQLFAGRWFHGRQLAGHPA